MGEGPRLQPALGSRSKRPSRCAEVQLQRVDVKTRRSTGLADRGRCPLPTACRCPGSIRLGSWGTVLFCQPLGEGWTLRPIRTRMRLSEQVTLGRVVDGAQLSPSGVDDELASADRDDLGTRWACLPHLPFTSCHGLV